MEKEIEDSNFDNSVEESVEESDADSDIDSDADSDIDSDTDSDIDSDAEPEVDLEGYESGFDEIDYEYSGKNFDEDYLINVDLTDLGELFTELETAIERFENFEILSNIIDKNPEILNCYKRGNQGGILYHDKVIKDIGLMKFLVNKGANPMLRVGRYCKFLISKACENGDLEIVKFLYETISKFENFKTENHMFKSLYAACCENNEDVIDFIHDKVSDEEIMNGLMVAIEKEYVNTIRLLAPKYKDPKIFKEAIRCENTQIIDILAPFYGQDLKLNCWQEDITPLQYSLIDSSPDIFYHLLKYFDIESTDNFGRTSLFYINSNNEDIIEYLMENSDLNHVDSRGNNAIMFFARKNLRAALSYKDRFDTTIRNIYGKNLDDILKEYSRNERKINKMRIRNGEILQTYS